MTDPQPQHIPVMLDEVLRALDPQPGQVYLDCTAGLGGHAAAVASRLGTSGAVILLDLDNSNLASASARVRSVPDAPRVHAVHASFASAAQRVADLHLKADLLLADLGFASIQVDDASRGLSFMHDGPLDMRLDPLSGVTAAGLVASLPQDELARIIRDYGEERHAGKVAARIVEARQLGPITRTTQLAELIRQVVRRSPDGIDPATRTFQALRMAVNDEPGNLEALLANVRFAAGSSGSFQGEPWLAPRARLAFIAFHSLEDRPIKQLCTELVGAGLASDLSGGAARPTDAETAANPRSRSARLRALALSS